MANDEFSFDGDFYDDLEPTYEDVSRDRHDGELYLPEHDNLVIEDGIDDGDYIDRIMDVVEKTDEEFERIREANERAKHELDDLDFDSLVIDNDSAAIPAATSAALTEELLAKQRAENRRRSSSDFDGIPDDIDLVLPITAEDELVRPEGSPDPGDKKIIPIAAAIAAGIAVISAGLVGLLFNHFSHVEQPQARETISPEHAVSGSAITGAPVVLPTQLSAPEQQQREVVIPEGGKRIEYLVRADRGIAAASTRYVNGSGGADPEDGISLPWTKVVGMKKDVTPLFKVSTTGDGTITCEIKENGHTIAQQTVSGNNPTVECAAP